VALVRRRLADCTESELHVVTAAHEYYPASLNRRRPAGCSTKHAGRLSGRPEWCSTGR
jgi:hypothetical protein